MSQSFLYYDPLSKPLSVQGVPMPGAKIQFYLTRTTTAAVIFADGGLQTPMSNPVILNSAGQAPPIYLDPLQNYRVIVYDPTGVVLEDVDPYGAPGAVGPTLVAGPSTNTTPEITINQGSTSTAGLSLVGTGSVSTFTGMQIVNNGLGLAGISVINDGSKFVQLGITPQEGLPNSASNLPSNTVTAQLGTGGTGMPLAIGAGGVAQWWVAGNGLSVQQNNSTYNAITNPAHQLQDMTLEVQSQAINMSTTLTATVACKWVRIGPFVSIQVGIVSGSPAGGFFSITGFPLTLRTVTGAPFPCPTYAFKNSGSALTTQDVAAGMDASGNLGFYLNGVNSWTNAAGTVATFQVSYNTLL